MLEVLQTKQDVRTARKGMKSKGLSFASGPLLTYFRRRNLAPGLSVGDNLKSWDVDRTLSYIGSHLPHDAGILDLGAFCSEVPPALARMNFTSLHGIDLNPKVVTMPAADKVKYTVGDFLKCPFNDASFSAITAISVIEHGYRPDVLFPEVSRLLRSGGYFIASFDYWPEKIDIGSTTFFNMSWLIFSASDVAEMVRIAGVHGLRPVGPMHYESKDRVVHCAGFGYTFAWIVFQKS